MSDQEYTILFSDEDFLKLQKQCTQYEKNVDFLNLQIKQLAVHAENLQKQVEFSKKERQAVEREKEALQKQIQNYKKIIQSKERQFVEKETLIKKMQIEHKNVAKNQLDHQAYLIERIKEMENQISIQNQDLHEKDLLHLANQQRIQKLGEVNEASHREIIDLKMKIQSLESSVELSNLESNEFQYQLKETLQKSVSLAEELNEKKQEEDLLKSRVDYLQGEVEAHEKERQTLMADIDEKVRKMAILLQEKKALERSQTKETDSIKQNRIYQEQLKLISEQNDRLCDENKFYKNKCQGLQEKLTKIQELKLKRSKIEESQHKRSKLQSKTDRLLKIKELIDMHFTEMAISLLEMNDVISKKEVIEILCEEKGLISQFVEDVCKGFLEQS